MEMSKIERNKYKALGHSLGLSAEFVAEWCNTFGKTTTDIAIALGDSRGDFESVAAAIIGAPFNRAAYDIFGIGAEFWEHSPTFAEFIAGDPLRYAGGDSTPLIARYKVQQGFVVGTVSIWRADGQPIVIQGRTYPAGYAWTHGETEARNFYMTAIKHVLPLSDELEATPTGEPTPAAPLSGELESDPLTDAAASKAWLKNALRNHFAPPQSATETQEADAPATSATPEPEIAPSGQKNGVADDISPAADVPDRELQDWQAFMAHRFDALERRLELVESVAPSGAMETDAPLPVQSKPKRTPAHVRAIMAYLAMRKQRDSYRHMAQGWRGKYDSTVDNATRFRRNWNEASKALEAEQESHAATQMALEKYQRRLEQERKLVADLREQPALQHMRRLTAMSHRQTSSLAMAVASLPTHAVGIAA